MVGRLSKIIYGKSLAWCQAQSKYLLSGPYFAAVGGVNSDDVGQGIVMVVMVMMVAVILVRVIVEVVVVEVEVVLVIIIMKMFDNTIES